MAKWKSLVRATSPAACAAALVFASQTPLPLRLLGFAEGREVDPELLALLVQMAAFEAEGAGDIGHMEIVAANFGKEDLRCSRVPCPAEAAAPTAETDADSLACRTKRTSSALTVSGAERSTRRSTMLRSSRTLPVQE